MRLISQIKSLIGKKVLLRIDVNVPIHNRKISPEGEFRINATLPTISYLRARGARVILISHFGRPDGKKVQSLSIAPIARLFSKKLITTVSVIDDFEKSSTQKKLEKMQLRKDYKYDFICRHKCFSSLFAQRP